MKAKKRLIIKIIKDTIILIFAYFVFTLAGIYINTKTGYNMIPKIGLIIFLIIMEGITIIESVYKYKKEIKSSRLRKVGLLPIKSV